MSTGQIQYVITMAGRGQRFADRGYQVPKYLIEAKGKTLLQHSIESLQIELTRKFFFVALTEHVRDFKLQETIAKLFPELSFEIIELSKITRGQAETALLAKSYLNLDQDLAIYNIDTVFRSSQLSSLLKSSERKDGVLGAFHSKSGDHWSFAKLDSSGNVEAVTEKNRISDTALTGFYHFTRAGDFIETAERAISENRTVRGEFYVAPLYDDLIRQGRKYVVDVCDQFIPLGTPDEVDAFKNSEISA